MFVPVVIFVVCVFVGVGAATQWLPALAVGPVGGLAFFVVCGLLGAALGLVGLHVYSIVEELNNVGGSFSGIRKATVVAEGLESMLFEAGALFGLAFVVYLLAPRAEMAGEAVTDASA